MARERGRVGLPSPKPVVSDFREILTFWKRREGTTAPGFVGTVFNSDEASDYDLSQILPAGDGVDVSPILSPAPLSSHRVTSRSKMSIMWWSITLIFLLALLLLFLSDWFEPQLYAESCDCQSLYDIMGWSTEEL